MRIHRCATIMLQPHLPIILKSGRFFKRSTTTPDDKKIGINVNQRRKRMDFPYSFTPLSPSFVFLPFFFLFFFLPFLFSPVYQAPPTRSTIFLAKYGHRVESESLTEQSLLNAIIIIIISIKNNSRKYNFTRFNLTRLDQTAYSNRSIRQDFSLHFSLIQRLRSTVIIGRLINFTVSVEQLLEDTLEIEARTSGE